MPTLSCRTPVPVARAIPAAALDRGQKVSCFLRASAKTASLDNLDSRPISAVIRQRRRERRRS